MDKKLSFKRRLIQVYAALLYNANLRGFIRGEIYTGSLKALCVPGLNCYSCPAAVGSCPLGALQNALASADKSLPFYMIALLLLLGLILGRTVCGWLCPAGLVQELCFKLPTPKTSKSRLTRILSWFKYGILAVFAVILPLYYAFSQHLPVPAFCKYICPVGTAEGAISLLVHPDHESYFAMLGGTFVLKFSLLVLFLLLSVFVYRFFCRFICPLGALYGLFNRIALAGIKIDENKCTHCGACVSVCPFDTRHAGDRECVACGKCITACTQKAITFRAGKIVLASNEMSAKANSRFKWLKPVLCTVLAALLFGMLWYFNFSPANRDSDSGTAAPAETVSVLPQITLPRFGGGFFDLRQAEGKILVLNFWATWCGPCIQELSDLEALAAAYPEEILVAAVHSSLVTDSVEDFLADADYPHLLFAHDTDGSTANLLRVSASLPHTVIFSPFGVEIYNAPGKLSAAMLTELLSPYLTH